MRVLGIDPGIALTGFAVLDIKGMKMSPCNYGCIKTSSKLDHVDRLEILYKDLNTIIETYQPDVAAVEKLFFNRNVTTALRVGEARGVILLSLSLAGIPVCEYTPLQVKQAVVGYGRAEKKQIQYMVATMLGLPDPPKPDDVADACAVAITHVNSYRFGNLIV